MTNASAEFTQNPAEGFGLIHILFGPIGFALSGFHAVFWVLTVNFLSNSAPMLWKTQIFICTVQISYQSTSAVYQNQKIFDFGKQAACLHIHSFIGKHRCFSAFRHEKQASSRLAQGLFRMFRLPLSDYGGGSNSHSHLLPETMIETVLYR